MGLDPLGVTKLRLSIVRVRKEASKPDTTGPSCDPGLRKDATQAAPSGNRHRGAAATESETGKDEPYI